MSDTIYRRAAIEALLEKGQRSKRYRLGDIWELNFDEIREAIATVPPAQSERPKGKWVGIRAYCDHMNEEAKVNGRTERYLPSGMVIGVYCDQCWCRANHKSKFCPNCGADMRGEQDG